MSVFDDVLGDSAFAPENFGPQEAFAGVLLAASASDGHMSDDELQSLFTILGRMKMFRNVPPQRFSSMLDRLMGILRRGGPGKLLEAALPAVSPELRETVFANACDIVLADGEVAADEKEFIDDLVLKLEIDRPRAKQIVQVMVYKNQG